MHSLTEIWGLKASVWSQIKHVRLSVYECVCVLTSVYNVVYDERERGRERGEIFWQGAEQREGSKLWNFFFPSPCFSMCTTNDLN